MLQTALHTLKHLTLDSLTRTSDFRISKPLEREHKDESLRICREVVAYLRDHSRLQNMNIRAMAYQRAKITVVDPFHDRQKIRLLYSSRCYNERHGTISFKEWIDQLEFVIA